MSMEPERALQYWDDLDDLVGAVALMGERIRRAVLFAFATTVFLLVTATGVFLAFAEPPLAMAIVTILVVVLFYRSATNPPVPGLEIGA